MDIQSKLRVLIRTAGTDHQVLNFDDTELILPLVEEELAKQAKTIGYDGFKGDADDYPEMVWTMVFSSVVAPTVHNWLNTHAPGAWFKELYAPAAAKED